MLNKIPYTEREIREICKKYDLLSAIQLAHNPVSDCHSFEREVGDDYNQKTGRKAKGAVTIPDFILVNAYRAGRTTRDVQSPSFTGIGSDYGNGASLVATDDMYWEYIQCLCELTCLQHAGIRILSGLEGDVAIPKGSNVKAGWIDTENGDSVQVSPSFSSILAEPHCIGGHAKISRRLNLQSAISIQSIIAETLIRAIAEGIEEAAFTGSGTSGCPLGLSGTSGVQTVSLSATPTRAEIISMWRKVLEKGIVGRNFAFIGTPAMKALLCQTLDVHNVMDGDNVVGAVTSGKYLCDGDKVEGFPFLMSTLCGDSLWFGEWSQFCLCSWSGVDLLADKYTGAVSGSICVTALQDVDFAVRRPDAFVKADLPAAEETPAAAGSGEE